MSRQQIVDTTYSAIAHLTRIKEQYNQITHELARAQLERITKAVEMEKRIDAIVQSGNESRLLTLKPELNILNGMDAIERHQLKLPIGGSVKLRYFNSLLEIIKGH
jgi:hypothetical protein